MLRELLLCLESLLLIPEPLLYFLLNGFLPGNGILLHPPTHLLHFEVQVFLFLHDNIAVSIVSNALRVGKLLLHVVSESLHALFVLEADFLLHQIFFVGELTLKPGLLFIEHLSESLLDKRSIVGELFLSFSIKTFMLASRANDDGPLFDLFRRWRS